MGGNSHSKRLIFIQIIGKWISKVGVLSVVTLSSDFGITNALDYSSRGFTFFLDRQVFKEEKKEV